MRVVAVGLSVGALAACGGSKSPSPAADNSGLKNRSGPTVRLTQSDVPDVIGIWPGIESVTRRGDSVDVHTTWMPGQIVVEDLNSDAADAALSACGNALADLEDPNFYGTVWGGDGSILANC